MKYFTHVIYLLLLVALMSNDARSSVQKAQIITPQDFVRQLSELAPEHSLFTMAELLDQQPLDILVAAAKALLDNFTSELKIKEKLQVIYAIVLKSKAHYIPLLNVLLDYPAVKEIPLFFVAADSPFFMILPMLVQWYQTVPKTAGLAPYMASWEQAIMENKVSALDRMCTNGVPLTTEQAQYLLWKVINEQKDAAFIPLLVVEGASANVFDTKGYTPLIKAVEFNNYEQVKALVSSDKNINLKAMSKGARGTIVGTALQKSLETPVRKKIELYLRAHGATESEGF